MVSAGVQEHFEAQLNEARQKGEERLAQAPSKQTIETMIDRAFWASLRREEGYSPKISLAYLPPEEASMPLLLEERLPFSSYTLTKMAPGVERPGIHLGVWEEEGQLYIWGSTQNLPNFCFVLDVSEPGLLVVKYRRKQGFGKFSNVAVLIGDQVKMVDQSSARLPDCMSLLTSLLSSDSATEDDSVNVLVQLAVSMRRHAHGGSLLIVPADTYAWHDSIIHPIRYAVKPAYTGLAELLQSQVEFGSQSLWKEALRKEVDNLAGLTAIDGATIINDRYELLAFGTKIARRKGGAPVEKILTTEPVIGGVAAVVSSALNGGTRHLSAAQFVHDQRNALALVASQDGRFTIFTWSACEDMVQAHQIDALLL